MAMPAGLPGTASSVVDSPYLFRYSTLRCRRNRPNILRPPADGINLALRAVVDNTRTCGQQRPLSTLNEITKTTSIQQLQQQQQQRAAEVVRLFNRHLSRRTALFHRKNS